MRLNPEAHYTFDQTHSIGELKLAQQEQAEIDSAHIAGRLSAVRDQGNLVFSDMHDQTGTIQVVANVDSTPDFEDYKTLNVGDWIGVRGIPGKTRRGEDSLFVRDWMRLAATEIPFPDKRKGLRDPDTIARQRYLDLATNPESQARFIARSRIISGVRNLLQQKGFIEVETPVLQTLYGGAAARPFETHHNALDMDMYLRIAPELYLKRLVVGGLERVFEIGKVFRNEGISTRHNPEFTMMEVYAAYWDHEDQMKLTEDVVETLAIQEYGTQRIQYQGETVDLTTPWRRATMDELVSEAVGEEISLAVGRGKLADLCARHGVEVLDGYGPGKLLLELYEKLCESKLRGPVFVTEYPKEVSPLAREHRSRPGYTERFEGIVAGRELCNGFSELNNAREQYDRFVDQVRQGEFDDEAMPMDHDYVRALQYGLPPTAGLGIGMDRLVMLLTNSASIRDVVLFPTLRPDKFVTRYEDEK